MKISNLEPYNVETTDSLSQTGQRFLGCHPEQLTKTIPNQFIPSMNLSNLFIPEFRKVISLMDITTKKKPDISHASLKSLPTACEPLPSTNRSTF